MYTFPPNDALYHVYSDVVAPVYLKPARKSGDVVGAVTTANSVNIVNIANIVDFNAMRYKKQYNDSSQVLVSRQTSESTDRDNFFAMYWVVLKVIVDFTYNTWINKSRD